MSLPLFKTYVFDFKSGWVRHFTGVSSGGTESIALKIDSILDSAVLSEDNTQTKRGGFLNGEH